VVDTSGVVASAGSDLLKLLGCDSDYHTAGQVRAAKAQRLWCLAPEKDSTRRVVSCSVHSRFGRRGSIQIPGC
jgi:hypothetical protein